MATKGPCDFRATSTTDATVRDRARLSVRGGMPLTEAQLLELQAEYFADDVPIDPSTMCAWTEAQARTYFDSGGATLPVSESTPPLQGLFALPPSRLISGAELPMSSLAGKPCFIMNVASR